MFNRFKEAFDQAKMHYGIGVSQTFSSFSNEINKLLVDRDYFDEEFFEDFEETLIELDIMPNLAITIASEVEKKIYNHHVKKDAFNNAVADVISELVHLQTDTLEVEEDVLNVWLIVGVNGVGKTTSISKIVNKHLDSDPLLAAADTFRAGAIEQLNQWAERLNVDIVKTHQGHAPSAVIYDAMDRAIEEKRKLLICDTSGRLHNKADLMVELEKIHRIIVDKTSDKVKLKTVLVLDGTAGKNTLEQAKAFNEITKLDGVIITKLDSGGKAGMIINISYELNVPIYYLTTGEQIEDIRNFDVDNYLEALFNSESE